MTMRRLGSIISTNWLREQIKNVPGLKNRPIRVIETTWSPDPNVDLYKEEYLANHIPSSQHFNFVKCAPRKQYFKHSVPDSNLFTDIAQSLGICDNTHVVTYDRTNNRSALRTWWLFRLYGHQHVSLLDGGFQKWIGDGFEGTSETAKFEKGNFEAKFASSLIRDYDSMYDNIKTKKEQIMDARSNQSFQGEKGDLEVKRGHFPGAKNIYFKTLFNTDGTFKSENELKLLFDAASIDLSKPVTAMCGTGLTACGLAMAGAIVGHETIPVYAGSMYEWGQKAPSELCVTGKS